MRTRTDIGSLRIVPMDATHVTGDGNDGDTTIMYKALAMAHGINLRSPQDAHAIQSMRTHRRWRLAVVVVGVVTLLILTGRMLWLTIMK